MADNTENIKMAIGGGLYWARKGTALPTDVPTEQNPLPSTFKRLGFCSADGISLDNSVDTTEIPGWPNGTTVRTSTSNGKVDAAVEFYEQNTETGRLWYAKEREADGSYVMDASYFGEEFVLLVNTIDTVRRTQELYVFPNAQLSARGQITLNHTTVTGYNATITARYSDEVGGEYKRFEGDWTPKSATPSNGGGTMPQEYWGSYHGQPSVEMGGDFPFGSDLFWNDNTKTWQGSNPAE